MNKKEMIKKIEWDVDFAIESMQYTLTWAEENSPSDPFISKDWAIGSIEEARHEAYGVLRFFKCDTDILTETRYDKLHTRLNDAYWEVRKQIIDSKIIPWKEA